MTVSGQLKVWFEEFINGSPPEVDNLMRRWFTNRRRDLLATELERVNRRLPVAPLKALFDAILLVKQKEAYSHTGGPFTLSQLSQALKRSSKGLISLSIELDREFPIILRETDGQFSWAEVGEHLGKVSEIIKAWWVVGKTYPHRDRRGGPIPGYFQNALLFLIWDVVKKSTGHNNYEAVADIFNGVGFPKELDTESVRRRLYRFKRILAKKYQEGRT